MIANDTVTSTTDAASATPQKSITDHASEMMSSTTKSLGKLGSSIKSWVVGLFGITVIISGITQAIRAQRRSDVSCLEGSCHADDAGHRSPGLSEERSGRHPGSLC